MDGCNWEVHLQNPTKQRHQSPWTGHLVDDPRKMRCRRACSVVSTRISIGEFLIRISVRWPIMLNVFRGIFIPSRPWKHYATNRQVAGSIPDGVIGIFQWHNPSGRTMSLGSTHPLTEMSTRCISWGWRRPVRKADNLTTILCRCHEIWEP
jgi:hypothetical protein